MIYLCRNDELDIKLSFDLHQVFNLQYSSQKHFSFRKQNGIFSNLHEVKPTAIKISNKFLLTPVSHSSLSITDMLICNSRELTWEVFLKETQKVIMGKLIFSLKQGWPFFVVTHQSYK